MLKRTGEKADKFTLLLKSCFQGQVGLLYGEGDFLQLALLLNV